MEGGRWFGPCFDDNEEGWGFNESDVRRERRRAEMERRVEKEAVLGVGRACRYRGGWNLGKEVGRRVRSEPHPSNVA